MIPWPWSAGITKAVMTNRPNEPNSRPTVAFITEQHVGLRTYSENLQRFVDKDERIRAEWEPITYEGAPRWWDRRPVPGPIRAALRGRDQTLVAIRRIRPDACLFMTQTPAALGGARARRRPYVVMVDDTPILYDRMASHYDQSRDRFPPLKMWKHRMNVAALRGAHVVLPMSEWARQSLIDDYGVAPNRTIVIPTGVDLTVWTPRTGQSRGAEASSGAMRVLFVGGHFERKGGKVLLSAFERLPPGTVELDLVTRTDIAASQGVRVHNGMQPNTPQLIALYQSSGVLVLPSEAEAYPSVIVEACATGLPCIVTRVGGMPEMIVDGESGFVIEPRDDSALADMLARLAADPELRARMSGAARQRAEELFDGRANARQVIDLLLDAAAAAPPTG
jgi:glycosyltransferase involved in cell wall biosynthesis